MTDASPLFVCSAGIKIGREAVYSYEWEEYLVSVFFIQFSYRQESGTERGGSINRILSTVQYHMINTWLVTVFCLIVLSICAVLRVIPGPARDDRFVAINTATTLAAGAALGISIYWGDLVILDISMVLITLCYAGTIAVAQSEGGEKV